MSEPSELWTSLLPKKGDVPNSSSRRHDYCRKVLELLAVKHPNLYSGQLGATLSFDEAQALVGALQKNTPGHIFKHRLSFLIRGLEKGVLEHDWDVAIPQAPLVIPRDKPRFTLESFTDLPNVYAVESAVLENLKLAPPKTYTTRIGQLLLSAILFSGLVRKRWFAPWVEALPSVVCSESLLWLNMTLTSTHIEQTRRVARKSGDARKANPDRSKIKASWEIRQRWFADPLTHTLILRWYKQYPQDLTAGRDVSPLLAIRQYLDLIFKTPEKITNLFVQKLLHGCATRTGLRLPSFLLAYAEEINKSVSLPSAVWERLLTGKCIITSSQELSDVVDEIPKFAESLPVPAARYMLPMLHQEKMLKEVFRIVLPPTTSSKRIATVSRVELQAYFEKNNEMMCQALSCLVLWSIDLLTHFNQRELIRGRVKCTLRASSVRSYLDAIGKRLIAVAGKTEVLSLESDELHDIYCEVINTCPTDKSKIKAATRLHGFHQFLKIKLGAPVVDFSDLGIKSGPAEAGVNANLISFDSFDRMKKTLCPNYLIASRMRKMQLLLAIIAFRCGLRRMEALKLRIIDVQGDVEPELLVRSNRYAYLKSSESIRRLPLACLLDRDELMLLLAWRRDREMEDEKTIPESLLFSLDAQPTVLLPDHEVFPPIMQAVHQVTGDSTLVFHHFRHSFANWMLLKLLKNFSPEVRKRFHFLEHQQFDPVNCDRLRKTILGNHFLGRQALFATAQLCGHAGPEITLLHYFHLCDWLLCVELANPEIQPKLDCATIENIAELPKHMLYYEKDKQKNVVWNMAIALERLSIPEELNLKSIEKKVDKHSIPELPPTHTDSKLPLWRRIISVLKEHQVGQLPYDILALRSGLAEKDIKTWCRNAELLASMKTPLGFLRHVNVNTRKSTDFHFPNLLREKDNRFIAEIVLTEFEKSSGRRKQSVIQGVREFVALYYIRDGGISCVKYQKLKKMVLFLTFLNVPLDQIHVLRVQPKSSKLAFAAVQKKLARSLGLLESSVVVCNQHIKKYSRSGYYILRVKNAHKDENGKLNGNYGFRYAMYMIAIMVGLE